MAIYEATLPFVWRLTRRFGVPDREREDVCQTVFLRVFHAIDDYDPSRPVRPWLFGITFRVASEQRRKCARLVPEAPELGERRVSTNEDPGSSLERREARDRLIDALSAIPLERRAVLVAHVLEELPIPAVAAALDIPLGTAYSRLRLARRDLVALLGDVRPERAPGRIAAVARAVTASPLLDVGVAS